MIEVIEEIPVSLGNRTHILRPVCTVFPTPGGITKGPNAYDCRYRYMYLQAVKIGVVWGASIQWAGSWSISREGQTAQGAFDMCEWELIRMYKELGDCLIDTA